MRERLVRVADAVEEVDRGRGEEQRSRDADFICGQTREATFRA